MEMRASRRGLSDWLIQRVSAILTLAYVLFMVGYLLTHSPVSFLAWKSLFSHTWLQVFTYLVILGFVGHIWIGIWTVITDYLKCAWGRLFLEILLALLLVCYLIWGARILWV